MRISRRASAISPFYAMEYGRRAAELIADGHDVIRFNIGEPDFGAPPEFLAAARELCDGRPLPYTDALGLPALREAIARFYSEHFRCEVPARRVVVTSGASAALLMACAALVDPGDEVLIADPSYPCNRQFAESFGGAQRRFFLKKDIAGIHAFVHNHNADAGFCFPANDLPVERRCSAVFGQQGGVDIQAF